MGEDMSPRERRVVRNGYALLLGITVLSVLVIFERHLWVRAALIVLSVTAGWWVMITRSRSRLRLVEQTLQDPLTGLYNRRHLVQRLAEECARTQRGGSCLTLAVLDLDDFKELNDRHGHLYGDSALRAFGRLLRSALRRSDIACRFGGEEFVVLFPDTVPERAVEVLQRMRHRLPHVPFSGGLAVYPTEAAEPTALLSLADGRLREAKRAGKAQLLVGSREVLPG